MLPWSVRIPLVLFGHLFQDVESGNVSPRCLTQLNALIKSFLNKPIELTDTKVVWAKSHTRSFEQFFSSWAVLIVLDDRHRIRVRGGKQSSPRAGSSSSCSTASSTTPFVEMPVSSEPTIMIVRPGTTLSISWACHCGEGLRMISGRLTRELKTRQLRLQSTRCGALIVKNLFDPDELVRLWIALRREEVAWKAPPLMEGGDPAFQASLKQRLIYQWLQCPEKVTNCSIYFIETTSQFLTFMEETWPSGWKYMMVCPVSESLEGIQKGSEWLELGMGVWEEPGGMIKVQAECVRGFGAWLVGVGYAALKKIPA